MNKLITYSFMKKETDIADTIDNNKLDNHIKKAQDRLRALIGPQFFDEVLAQVSTNPTSLSTDNLAFYDPYVKQYVAWNAYASWIVKANMFESRAGMRIIKEENSDPASDKMMVEAIQLAKRDAQFYTEAVLNFLNGEQRKTTGKYPLYRGSCGKVSSGFGFSAVSKIDNVRFRIDNSLTNQEP